MADKVSPEVRSRIMASVRHFDTAPELAVRSLLHRKGFRFRLHRKDLPGNPDIVLPRHHKVIFVHGCFWHGHVCKKGKRKPQTNIDFWKEKIFKNKKRDRAVTRKLRRLEWKVLVVWECQLSDLEKLNNRIDGFLKK